MITETRKLTVVVGRMKNMLEATSGLTGLRWYRLPEARLHPEDVRDMGRTICAQSKSYPVLVLTHSLTLLYTINNCVLAHALRDDDVQGVPPLECRVAPKDVIAYSCETDEPIVISDEETGFISEAVLGRVAAELDAEMNRIGALVTGQEKRT